MSSLCNVAPVACYQASMPVRRTAFGDSGHSVMYTWMVALSLRQPLAKDRSWPIVRVRWSSLDDGNRCKPDLQHGSLFSSRSSHRHILPPRRVLRRAPLLLHSPILALVRPPRGT